MRRWILPTAVALGCLAWTQGPDTPRVGWLKDGAGDLRAINGIAGNFVPGAVRLAGVVSAASSGAWTFAKTGQDLIVLDRRGMEKASLPLGSGGALFAFSPGGEPAAAYLPDMDLLLLWNDGRFEPVPWRAGHEERVQAIGCPEDGVVSLLVRRDKAIWQVNRAVSDGHAILEWPLPGVGPPVLLRPDGSLIYADGKTLIRRSADSHEQKVELPETILELNELGEGLVSARAADHATAVLFLGAQPRVFELPGAGR